jgi:hypothetical protein
MLWLVIPCCFAAGCGSDRPDETGVAADTQAEGAATRAVPEPGATVSAPGSPDEVPVTISVTAGGGRSAWRAVGTARCHHTEQASIYGVAAAMWSVEYRGDEGAVRHLNLTVWQPRSAAAPDQFSFTATRETTSHRIATVRGGETVGSGSIALHREGAGARFEITGRDAEGADVRATVQCTRFTAPSPAGG